MARVLYYADAEHDSGQSGDLSPAKPGRLPLKLLLVKNLLVWGSIAISVDVIYAVVAMFV